MSKQQRVVCQEDLSREIALIDESCKQTLAREIAVINMSCRQRDLAETASMTNHPVDVCQEDFSREIALIEERHQQTLVREIADIEERYRQQDLAEAKDASMSKQQLAACQQDFSWKGLARKIADIDAKIADNSAAYRRQQDISREIADIDAYYQQYLAKHTADMNDITDRRQRTLAEAEANLALLAVAEQKRRLEERRCILQGRGKAAAKAQAEEQQNIARRDFARYLRSKRAMAQAATSSQ
jgi:hypothetical protein